MGPFEIFDLEGVVPESLEQLGTKEKFWFTHPALGSCLCKFPRPHTGEDWAEVVASQLAQRMKLPHASYFFGIYGSANTVITPTFAPKPSTLILGNQLLVEVFPDKYGIAHTKFRQQSHTIHLVMTALASVKIQFPLGWVAMNWIDKASDLFIGYLALDALIGNTDRHHENWGVIAFWEQGKVVFRLAPTFDHASSLGCHLRDDTKSRRLETRDLNYSCEAYARKAQSALFLTDISPKPLSTIDAFLRAAQMRLAAAKGWLDVLNGIDDAELAILLKQVPVDRLSDTSRQFALRMLIANRHALVLAGKTL